jgi:hypothetical protein
VLGVPILLAKVVSNNLDEQQAKGIATHSMNVNPYHLDLHMLQDVSC